MRFVYKINSSYDGFTPKRIPERLERRRLLRLGWARYINVIRKGQEVWVYFRGPHKVTDGIYAKGFVHSIDFEDEQVLLRVREHSADVPLTSAVDSERIGRLVDTWYRQVFPLPEDWEAVPECTVDSTASSCEKRRCGLCKVWKSLPRIGVNDLALPSALPSSLIDFVPAYWVIPSRCFLFYGYGDIRRAIRHTSELFYRFKLGEKEVAFPLALAVYESLRTRGQLDFDAVVPIPLSPKKAAAGELHRTRLLASKLSQLLGVRVVECLSLEKSESKGALLSAGYIPAQIEKEYHEALAVDEKIIAYDRVLLVDDVCTRGRTLRSAVRRLRSIHDEAEIVAACAGQMIVKEAVQDPDYLID